jgi:hypothetical protein
MIPGSLHVASRSVLCAALLLALTPATAAPADKARASPAAARKQAPAKAGKVPAKKPKPASAVAPAVLPALPRSDMANRLIAWVAAAHDNGTRPYAVIDKPAATLYLFSGNGTFLGATPVLLGIGVGDDSSPGIGAKKLEEIGPAERTTPAGRFVAKFGRAFGRQQVLWVDYANAVAIHAVITTHKKERRVERLLSPGVDDNRISFGCINVGTRFYTGKLKPMFEKKGGIVYILPDVKTLDEVFPRVRLLPYLGARQESAS